MVATIPGGGQRNVWDGPTLLQSFLTIVEVITVCAFGALLAHLGIITQPVRTAMSKVGFYLLLPAITFVKVAEAVDATILARWWPLAANLVFSIAVGIAAGYILSRLLRVPRPLERTVVVASSIGNINTIPLLVVASLCQSDTLMFRETLGGGCSTLGIAYVAVGMAVGSVFHHSLAFHMLKPPKSHDPDGEEGGGGGGGGGGGDGDGLPTLTASCPTCGREGARAPTADGGGAGLPALIAGGRASSHGGGPNNLGRTSSIQSWESDDMFSGLETFTEAAAYLHTPGHAAWAAHHFGTPWGRVVGPWAVGWGGGWRAGAGRPGTPRPGSGGGIHRRPRSTSAPEVGSPVLAALKASRGGVGGPLAAMEAGGGGGAGDEEPGSARRTANPLPHPRPSGAGSLASPRFPTIPSVGDGLGDAEAGGGRAAAAARASGFERAPSLGRSLHARRASGQGGPFGGGGGGGGGGLSIISLEASSVMSEAGEDAGSPAGAGRVGVVDGSPDKGHSGSGGSPRAGDVEAGGPPPPPPPAAAAAGAPPPPPATAARRARCCAACLAHPTASPLVAAGRAAGRLALALLSPFLWVLVTLEKLLPVPALISLAGIAVGCCPPLKKLFFGPRAPLEFAAHALHTVAGATVPVMSFILGAVLYKGPGRGATVRWHVIAGVCLVRLLLLPLLGAAVVFATEAWGWWKPLDPLFVFTLLLQWIAPTAINMQAIATMFRYKEADMGALIFWQHAVYLFSLPLYICGVMHWLDRLPMSWEASPHGHLAPTNDPGVTP